MERIERRRSELEGLCIASRREQVDRIPNTTLLQKAVKACAHCHGDASREASFHFSTTSLSTFHLSSFSLAVVIHLLTSLLVGLLYGAMLPMFPRRPILLGGVIAPILWTGVLHSILGLINPLLDARIDWPWFIASQFAFGIVAGLVVMRQERVSTRQFEPFVIRAGIEAPGLKEENPNRSGSR